MQTWCQVRNVLRKLHSGRPLLSKQYSSRRNKALSKAVSEESPDNTQTSKVLIPESARKVPLFVEQLSKSGNLANLLGENQEDYSETSVIPESIQSLEEWKQSLEELESELKMLRALKKTALKHQLPVRNSALWGTSDPDHPASNIPCGGCGAMLHCNDSAIPGFIPQEKFKGLMPKDLETTLCLRCHCMSNQGNIVDIEVDKAVYKQVVKKIRMEKALVLMVVDVTDITNSLITDYVNQVGKMSSIIILGNKIDLIPKDSDGYLARLKDKIWEECLRANLNPRGNNIKDIRLISAKTGYGIEDLITKLISYWKLKGAMIL